MVLGWGKKMTANSHKDDEDMTMEEILASIRKYVTDDHSAGKKAPATPVHPETSGTTGTTVRDEPPSVISLGGTHAEETIDKSLLKSSVSDSFSGLSPDTHVPHDSGDILDLTQALEPVQVVHEEGAHTGYNGGGHHQSHHTHTVSAEEFYQVLTESKAPASHSAVHPSPEFVNDSEDFVSTSHSTVTPMTQLHAVSNIHTTDALASSETVTSSSSALHKLVQAVKPQVQHATETSSLPATPTLDTFIAGLARPMVKDWIDQNLTKIVEQMVAREIEKITRGLGQ
jgi:cell pole-organizing protein PopZ